MSSLPPSNKKPTSSVDEKSLLSPRLQQLRKTLEDKRRQQFKSIVQGTVKTAKTESNFIKQSVSEIKSVFDKTFDDIKKYIDEDEEEQNDLKVFDEDKE